jgi:Uma2 family endonuclease
MRLPQPALDAHEYLQREARVDQRYEFVNGQAYPLSSGTLQHGQLITRILGHAFNAAERHPRCNVLTQSVKLHVPARNSFYYPDVMVTCEPVFREQDIVRAPCCVVEVLSPSTANIDRREKRIAYMTLGSLEQYLVVDQSRMRADVYWRAESGWNLSILREPEQIVEISCLDCTFTLQQLYEGVDLPLRVAEEEPEEEWLTA